MYFRSHVHLITVQLPSFHIIIEHLQSLFLARDSVGCIAEYFSELSRGFGDFEKYSAIQPALSF